MTGIGGSQRLPKAYLVDLFQAALGRVNGRLAVSRHLVERPIDSDRVAVIAIGKAASAMMLGAIDALGESLATGLLITKHDHLDDACRRHPRLDCIEAAHPVPDGNSLEAGRRLLALLSALPPEQPLLVLISGGASSLVEVLPEGRGVTDLEWLNQWLLSQHLDIGQMNSLRRDVSLIKGGRLAAWLGGRKTRQLLISDVPGDQPWVIGSGLLVPPGPSAHIDPHSVERLPERLVSLLAEAPPLPDADAAMFACIDSTIVASNRQACEAVAAKARELGHPGDAVVIDPSPMTGDALDMGERIAGTLIASGPGVRIWGGETTVALPDHPGRGGRAQAMALKAATLLEGRPDICLLVAGTDGTDGPGEDAGAVVDGQTCARGRLAGLEPLVSLLEADSGTFLAASGDLLRTGPTGTNVMDLAIGLRFERS